MRDITMRFFGILASLILTLGFSGYSAAESFEITIEVAPNVLNIQSEAQVVTVHTDVPYGLVDAYSVELNGVPINTWKADNRGNFVAKFLMSEIEENAGLVIDSNNLLMLVGSTGSWDFWGTDEILVINIIPKKR